ncbi:MAG: hypothetical protein H7335_16260, partial [Massilia sp.]|nr:hypothetical protein [Massilia sp.]
MADAGEGVTPASNLEHDFPQAGEMPAWLKEPEPQPSMLGRRALAWGAALVAVAALAAGGLWLRDEQKSRVELDAIARSPRAADAAIATAAQAPAPIETKAGASAPAVVPSNGAPVDATALIERKPSTLPPLVTLPPEQAGAAANAPVPAPVSAPAPVPGAAAPMPAQPPAPVVAAGPEPVAPAAPVARPASKPVTRPAPQIVAKAPPKVAVKAPVRTLRAAPWPPAPSRKLPLAQNVLPKPAAKPKRQAALVTPQETPKKVALQVKPKLAAVAAASRAPGKGAPKKVALVRPAAKVRAVPPAPRARTVTL